jgi:hypothetical protein
MSRGDVLIRCSEIIVDIPHHSIPVPFFYYTKSPLVGSTKSNKLESLKKLRKECIPLLLQFFKSVPKTAFHGVVLRVAPTQGEVQDGVVFLKHNLKTDESIIGKCERPELLKELPKFGIEHIRDALRFKVVVDNLHDAIVVLCLLVQHNNGRSWKVVKLDLDKLLHPKVWGWRFIGCDLQAANGLLIECYISFKHMDRAKKEGNHKLFERWRQEDMMALGRANFKKYMRDVRESRDTYNKAFVRTLDITTRAEFTSLFRSFPESKQKEAGACYTDVMYESLHGRLSERLNSYSSMADEEEREQLFAEDYKRRRVQLLKNKELLAIVRSWERGTINATKAGELAASLTEFSAMLGHELANNGVLEHVQSSGLDNPVFTHFVEHPADNPRPEVVFYEDHDWLVFPNKDTIKEDSEGGGALSFVHLLAVPKRRIYNAVSLRSSHRTILESLQRRMPMVMTSQMVKDYYIIKR